MNDKNFKDMWSKAEYYMGNSHYNFSSIEKFISSNSNLVSEKILKLYKQDIVVKLVILLFLLGDAILYYNIQRFISYYAMVSIALVGVLLWFEFGFFKQFQSYSDNSQNTSKRLSQMLHFLRTQSFVSMLSISTTYLFGFPAAMLIYFFAEYGELRRMESLDYLVFPAICLLGIIFTYVYNSNTFKFQKKQLELCMSDLDENLLPYVSEKIVSQQKNDRMKIILVGLIVLLGFFMLVAILKAKGF